MSPAATIHFDRAFRALALGGALLVALPAARAGQKIQFSDKPGQYAPPDKPSLVEPDYAKPFESLGTGSSTANAVLATPKSPAKPDSSTPQTKEQKRALDRQKNWIFVTPDTDPTTTTAEAMRVRAAEGDRTEKDDKGVMETYLEKGIRSRTSSGNSRTNKAGATRDAREKTDRYGAKTDRYDIRRDADPLRDGDSLKENEERGSRTNSEPGGTFSFDKKQVESVLARVPGEELNNSLLPPDFNRQSGFNPPGALRPEKTEEQRARADDFKQLLDPRAARSASVRGATDPINLLDDTTRQQVNPVVGQNLEAFRPAERRNPLEPVNKFDAQNRFAPLNLLNDLNARMLGSSSLSPAALAPPPTALPPPQPAVLEIPKRKL